MNIRQEGEEPERRKGLGGRVRRFVENELSRVVDTEGRESDRDYADYRGQPDRASEFRRHEEPVAPHADAPGHPSPPGATAPAEPGYGAPEYGAPAADPGAEEARTGQFHRSSDEVAADGSAERVGLLNNPAGLRDQWQRVQGTFVDDPQRAVQEASVLVERTLQEIHENVTRGQISDPTSTEELRVSFQRYREFFQRLLSA
jgi:hypothetical protein